MKKLLQSLPIALFVIALAGGAVAYKVISRRDRVERKATEERIRSEVKSSIGSIPIELPPLFEAGRGADGSPVPSER
jgi:hypothetical protein